MPETLRQNLEIFVGAKDEATHVLESLHRTAADVFGGSRGIPFFAGSASAAVAGIATAAVGVGAGLFAIGKAVGEAAHELSDLSEKTGISATDLSTLKYAAEASETSMAALETGLKRLSVGLLNLGGNSVQTIDALKKIGIEANNTDGTLKTSQDILMEVATAFSSMPDGIDKAAVAVALFGRSGTDLIPMLNQGAAGIDAMRQKARELGLELGENTIQKANELDDAMDQLHGAWEGLKIQIGSAVLPAVVSLTNEAILPAAEATVNLVKATRAWYDRIAENDVLQTLGQTYKDIKEAISGVAEVAKIDIPKAMGDAETEAEGLLGGFDKLAEGIAKNTGAIKGSITTDFKEGTGSAVTSIGGIKSNWTLVSQTVEGDLNGIPNKMKLAYSSGAGNATVELQKIDDKWEEVKKSLVLKVGVPTALDEANKKAVDDYMGLMKSFVQAKPVTLAAVWPQLDETEKAAWTAFKTKVQTVADADAVELSTKIKGNAVADLQKELDAQKAKNPIKALELETKLKAEATKQMQADLDARVQAMPLKTEIKVTPAMWGQTETTALLDQIEKDMDSLDFRKAWGHVGAVWGATAGKALQDGVVKEIGDAFGSGTGASATAGIIGAAVGGGIVHYGIWVVSHVLSGFKSVLRGLGIGKEYTPETREQIEAEGGGPYQPTIAQSETKGGPGYVERPSGDEDRPGPQVQPEPFPSGSRNATDFVNINTTAILDQSAARAAHQGYTINFNQPSFQNTAKNWLLGQRGSNTEILPPDTIGEGVDWLRGQLIASGRIPEYVYYAKGGLVDRPTMALVGEQGPEYVLNARALDLLNNLNAGRGQGFVGGTGTQNFYVFNINAQDALSFEQYLQAGGGQKIVQYLFRESERGTPIIWDKAIRTS